MARLFTVTMTFCLFAASLAAIDLSQLPGLIQKLKTDITNNGKYMYPMYAVAMSIPAQDSYGETITDALTDEERENIKNSLLHKQNRLVIATKKDISDGGKTYTDHAEYRVLQNLGDFEVEKGDFLVFFSHASPCDEKCANPKSKFRITDKLRNIFNNEIWGEKAFVFEYLFKPQGQNFEPDKIKLALEHVGKAVGLQNIFRCYTRNGTFQCISCADDKNVTKNCYTE